MNYVMQDDRRLAAALVAVQFHHQKQQQLHIQSQHEDPTLPDVSHLETLAPVNSYSIQTVPEPNTTSPVYPPLQPFKRITQNVKQEFINVKSEYDVEVSTESSEDATSASGPKKTLPHKKRIPRKLKQQQTKKNASRKDNSKSGQENTTVELASEIQVNVFKCELCSSKFNSQLKFFEHLKVYFIYIEIIKQPI